MAEKTGINECNPEFIKKEVLRSIMENDNPYIVKNGEMYDVHAVNLHFKCCYTDEEMEQIASLCLELLEELKRINNSGYTREELNKAAEEAEKKSLDICRIMDICKTFMTERAEEIVAKLGQATRVGGAYYMLLSRPTFMSAIYVTFDALIDQLEDPNAYLTALFMLVRMAMHMHCDEISG